MTPTREQAIRALNSLFDRAFGNEKGSDEIYIDWCESHGLCTYEDDDDEPLPSDWPGQFAFLTAVGITPQELIDVLHVNPAIFDTTEPT